MAWSKVVSLDRIYLPLIDDALKLASQIAKTEGAEEASDSAKKTTEEAENEEEAMDIEMDVVDREEGAVDPTEDGKKEEGNDSNPFSAADNFYYDCQPVPKERDDLPSVDLLHGIHKLASHYFASHPAKNRMIRSLDGSALLATGILMDEYMKHLVDINTQAPPRRRRNRRWKIRPRRRKQVVAAASSKPASSKRSKPPPPSD